MSAPVKYAIDPIEPFPQRWFDHHGNITVMAGPVRGYLMVRRPGRTPFVLSVTEMLNARPHPYHGPFTLIETTKRKKAKP